MAPVTLPRALNGANEIALVRAGADQPGVPRIGAARVGLVSVPGAVVAFAGAVVGRATDDAEARIELDLDL